jgi:dCMP deaminase
MGITKWDKRFMLLAREISTWSKDPSKKIGAVAIGENRRILSTGYNGFPAGIDDSDERLDNREDKYKYVVHAEKNCIYNACHNGISLNGSTLYVWGLPVCSECAKGVIQVGVTKVFYGYSINYDDSVWLDSFRATKSMFDEVGIEVHRIDPNELF